jgi:predicted urease superfamily metal-dependent hydrolase
MSAAHTPGEWSAKHHYGNTHSVFCAHNNYHIATIRGKENALLMAAAPDMLKALKTAKWMLERDYIDDVKRAVIEKCDAAIAKTTGETP